MMRIRCVYRIVILLALGLVPLAAAVATEQFKMLTLQYRFAQDILPMIAPMVGPEGSVRALDNHLLVSASPARLAQIEAVVRRLDVARRNLRITVSHATERQAQQHSAGVTVGARSGHVEVQIPPGAKDGVNIDLNDRNTVYGNMGNEFLTVTDGERAFIRVGQSVPYTQHWVVLAQRYVGAGRSVEFHDVTTGFAVRPRTVGNLVELEITPRIVGLNQAGLIDFEELSTVVRVSIGEWFDLGGSMQNRDEVSRAIFANYRASGSQNSTLRIKVE